MISTADEYCVLGKFLFRASLNHVRMLSSDPSNISPHPENATKSAERRKRAFNLAIPRGIGLLGIFILGRLLFLTLGFNRAKSICFCIWRRTGLLFNSITETTTRK